MKRILCILAFLALATAATAEEHVYFGNLHSHTSYSDGSGTPEEAYRHARDVAKLDFLAITEHNHAQAEDQASPDRKDGILIAKDHSLYEDLKKTAARFNKDGEFIAIYGQEVSSIAKGNHMNVFEVANVVDEKAVPNGRFDLLFKAWLPGHPDSTGQPPVVQLNHPYFRSTDHYWLEYGQDDFPSREDWLKALESNVRTIELRNGPAMARDSGHKPEEFFEPQFLKFLGMGLRVAPSADQDNHYKTWGTVTDARTGIVADALTKPKLLEALRQRHVYATDDKDLQMVFKVDGHLAGDAIDPAPAAKSALDIQYRLSDVDEPNASYKIQVWSGSCGLSPVAGVVQEFPVAAGEATGQWKRLSGIRYFPGYAYIFFKVLQSDGDRAWSAAVWFGPRPTAPAGAGPEPQPKTKPKRHRKRAAHR
ncbi:MAG: CehA/McbA family metallohydrolase [Candidatus Wallbacteria bacterium]|nr:CehA/McbA family metallohydrolase [Candidatus Wallbacteria bacterium]